MAYEFIDSIGNDVDVVSDSEVSSVWFYHYMVKILYRSVAHLIGIYIWDNYYYYFFWNVCALVLAEHKEAAEDPV